MRPGGRACLALRLRACLPPAASSVRPRQDQALPGPPNPLPVHPRPALSNSSSFTSSKSPSRPRAQQAFTRQQQDSTTALDSRNHICRDRLVASLHNRHLHLTSLSSSCWHYAPALKDINSTSSLASQLGVLRGDDDLASTPAIRNNTTSCYSTRQGSCLSKHIRAHLSINDLRGLLCCKHPTLS